MNRQYDRIKVRSSLSRTNVREVINRFESITEPLTFNNNNNNNIINSSSSSNSEEDGIYCDRCGYMFTTSLDYDLHRCRRDNISSCSSESCLCPICNKSYSSQEFLGEHFLSSHNNYEELTSLDKKEHDVYGFAGFDLLKRINYVSEYSTKEKESYVLNKKRCAICTLRYQYPVYIIPDNDEEENVYYSDSELLNTIKRNLSDIRLVEVYNKFSDIERLPIKLNCCSKDICHDCLQDHLSITDSLICPFCGKDGTRTDLDYIIDIEITNTTESSRWLWWWENHVHIFD